MSAPLSTYRIQFNRDFRFLDGARVAPYLAALGVDWLYASPYFQARPGSMHGYDVVDPNTLNTEIGTDAEHRAMIAALRAAGRGHLLDFVPNHMGIGPDNPWWWDVLTFGQQSPYALFFDIDWAADPKGRLVLPFLVDHYGAVVDRGELRPTFDLAHGGFVLAYFESRFPLAPRSGVTLLIDAAERDRAADLRRALETDDDAAMRATIAQLVADAARDTPLAERLRAACERLARDADAVDALASDQEYRLAFWRSGPDEINYRRFFDINDLAGLRVEDADVLAQTHRTVLAMIDERRIDGLRIDHIDGLYNPGGYVNFLADRASTLESPLYLVVEKILGVDECLRPDWRIAGTTGYDFMALVTGLFIDAAAEPAFDRLYRRATGRERTFAEEVEDAKARVMRVDLASELNVLAERLARIARSDRRSVDFTTRALRAALAAIITEFPVYRTYVVDDAIDEDDCAIIDTAVERAIARAELRDEAIFMFVRDVLTARVAADPTTKHERRAVLQFAMRFQQYTGPVTAKSVEDTAFYRYVRLVALNDVGSSPDRFGTSIAAFHRANEQRAARTPRAMLATATHDHKRGEDTRLRIAALSEMASEWARAVGRWTRMNAAPDAPGPSRNDEYLFYQTVVGTYPVQLEPLSPEERATYLGRLSAYMQKAMREAKLRTSWADPNADYEAGVEAFIERALDPQRPFDRDVAAFVTRLAPGAAVAGLAQTVLKLTVPGVPDMYAGTERWDFSLVDPDNRRTIDFDGLAQDVERFRAAPDRGSLIEALTANWHDGRIKHFVMMTLLRLREEQPERFRDTGYSALATTGDHAARVVAFTRGTLVVIVPRLVGALTRADDLGVTLAMTTVDGLPAGRAYRDIFDDRPIVVGPDGRLDLTRAFGRLPLTVLIPTGD